MPSVVRRLAWLLMLGYLVLLTVVFGAPFAIGAPELTGVLRSLLIILLLPSPVLVAVSVAARWRSLAVAMAVPFLGFVLVYGPFLVPRSSAEIAPHSVTFLTWNLRHEAGDIRSIADVIRAADADIVAVQELSIEASAQLDLALRDLYPHRALYPNPDARSGTGLLSRHRIVAVEYAPAAEDVLGFGHLRATVDFDGERITVYNVHPVPSVSLEQGVKVVPHSRQLRGVLERALAESGPVVLVGDFNMTDQFDEYRSITERFSDAYRLAGEVGLGFTFPSGDRLPLPPLVRIDFVFSNSHWRPTLARVMGSPGVSDHRPVWARLALLSRADRSHADSESALPI